MKERIALVVHGLVRDLKSCGWLSQDVVPPEGMKLGIVFVSSDNMILDVQFGSYADHVRFVARDYRKHTAANILNVSPSHKDRLKQLSRRGPNWDQRPPAGSVISFNKSAFDRLNVDISDLEVVTRDGIKVSPTKVPSPASTVAAPRIAGRGRKAGVPNFKPRK